MGGALAALPAVAAPPMPSSAFGLHPTGIFRQGYKNNGHADAIQIGAKWSRIGQYAFWSLGQPELNSQTYDFSETGGRWGNAQSRLDYPGKRRTAARRTMSRFAISPGRTCPSIPTDRPPLLRATVERYDGDGIADMPGLTNPVKYWQVRNKPSPFEATNFDEFQRITSTAIKATCPECTVLIGGAVGYPPASDYITKFDRGYKQILDALAGKYVDIMDLHYFGGATGDYRGLKDVVAHVRDVLNTAGFAKIPIWITEMGSYSGAPLGKDYAGIEPRQTEAQQAQDYFKRFVYALSHGAQKVFSAYGLIEGFDSTDRYFDHTGLIYDGEGSDDRGLGVKKLSYYAYRKMTEILEGRTGGA